MRYRSSYSSRGYRGSSTLVDYLMPFLIVIAVGIIIVLVYNLWKAVYDNEPEQAAYMYIVEGSAKMKTWGTDDYFDLSSGSLLFQGDELQTSENAMIIIEFFDGSIMRVNGGSDLIFEEIRADEKLPYIKVLLVDGKAWVNKVYRDVASTEFVISMDNILVNSADASVFSVENEFDEIVRVLSGKNVLVDVLSEGDKRVVETESLGLGQEIEFTDEVLSRYWQYQSPTVLSALSETFMQSSWYKWNIAEDRSPTDFQSGQVSHPAEILDESLTAEDEEGAEDEEVAEEEESVEEESAEEEEESPEEEVASAELTTPSISSVANLTSTNADGFYEVSSRVATLTGTVSGAEKVVVSGYTLQQFKPGDTTWTYYANADYDLMEEGENVYEIEAFDADGNKSGTLTVKVFYSPPAPAPAQEEEVEQPEEPESTDEPEAPAPPED